MKFLQRFVSRFFFSKAKSKDENVNRLEILKASMIVPVGVWPRSCREGNKAVSPRACICQICIGILKKQNKKKLIYLGESILIFRKLEERKVALMGYSSFCAQSGIRYFPVHEVSVTRLTFSMWCGEILKMSIFITSVVNFFN